MNTILKSTGISQILGNNKNLEKIQDENKKNKKKKSVKIVLDGEFYDPQLE